MSETTKMQYRAISPQQAIYVGNAAAYAGGYVATEGPLVWRMSDAEATDLLNQCLTPAQDEELLTVVCRHRLRGGDWCGLQGTSSLEPSAGCYIMCVPEGHKLSSMGWGIPVAVIDEAREQLARYEENTGDLLQ